MFKDQPADPNQPGVTLTWTNVALGLLFIVFDAILSGVLGLGVGRQLIIAAIRCILQLSVMGLILGKVFESNSIWAVGGIATALTVTGAIEATYNKSKRRFTNMFPCILASMLAGAIPMSVLGERFAMGQRPFWQPDQYVPVLGMLLGNAISAISIAMNLIGKEFTENRDKVETYLAFGASRFEAVRPVAVDALSAALLPTINQMSIIGLISIPGMMTGAIVGGKSVEQAAKLQMIIMFIISASSALCALFALYFACTTIVDAKHRVRPDRIDSRAPAFYRWRDALAEKIWHRIRSIRCFGERGSEEERRGLLDNGVVQRG